ncbi:MAG: flagellar export protein FliJ [Nitrosomonas sp.]|jgi:flagellar FliJ protein|nr:flagellar export protein FliJ [Nitrosomonas sp.]MCC7136717.1 flagellar export protein FliJ [Nitrosomonas sp.]
MATPRTLKLLTDHARKQTDDSAIKLGKLNHKQRESEKTLKMLLDYRKSYQQQLAEYSTNAVNPIQLRNFMAFISKLDVAIAEQQKLVAHTHKNTAAGSSEFQQHRQKLKTFDTLTQKHEHKQAVSSMKHEQKQQDEHTTHNTNRRKSSS